MERSTRTITGNNQRSWVMKLAIKSIREMFKFEFAIIAIAVGALLITEFSNLI